MRLFDLTPTSADLDSRGFTAALQALLSVISCFFCVGFAIEAGGWIFGTTLEPEEVTLPGRGGLDTFGYAPDTGWFIFLSCSVFGLLFAVVAMVLCRRAVRAFRRTSKTARLAEQRQRRAMRNRNKRESARPLAKSARRKR